MGADRYVLVTMCSLQSDGSYVTTSIFSEKYDEKSPAERKGGEKLLGIWEEKNRCELHEWV